MARAFAIVALISLTGTWGTARADEDAKAKCSLRVIQATHDGAQHIDPEITKLRPWLEREPFDDWKNFKLVRARELLLAPKASDSEMLPNGRKATVTYVDHLLEKGKHRVRLKLLIEQGATKEFNTTFVLDEGGTFVHVAQKKVVPATEMVIVGLSCEIPH